MVLSSTHYFAYFVLLGIITLNNAYRLPETIKPINYRLEILTHLNDYEGFKFFGKVWIQIDCLEDTNVIKLHSVNLTINPFDVKLSKFDENVTEERVNYVPIDNCYQSDFDFFLIEVKETLKKGQQYLIYIPFESSLSESLTGYYKSSYFDLKSQKKIYLAVTQFEPFYARQAFPCFDEPSMKATFDITLGHHKNYTALSNMPIKSSETFENNTQWVWDHFNKTVPMSTYLVAYSINDFEYREAIMNTDIKFKIWARRDAINQVDYAKYVGPKVLKFYENYFDEKYPLPKMDMIALPDFSAGAMENWGLITYRETALLYKPNISSASSQHRVASVIAHELAHQWFGNLVTMEWWTDLWLNEGFATYVASLGVHFLHPEWNSLVEESVDNTINIFKFDSLKSSHPVSVTIGNPSEISQIFDSISYKKGSSVIRMMHLFLGEESFRYGVSRYLKDHKYGNAEQDDLWESLTQEAHTRKALSSNLTVKAIMDSWTLQTGYPVITVIRDYTNKTADITQTRYLSDTIRLRNDLTNCWTVPLSYTGQNELDFNATQAKDWLQCGPTGEQITKTISNMPNDDEWIIFNIQFAGLYKVKYDDRNWDLLISTLTGPNFATIHSINRAQLIDDALDLAWTGDQDYSIALRIVQYLRQEREYIPWKTALDNLNSVNRMLRRTPKYGFFKTYMHKVLTPIYEAIGGLNADKVPDRLDAVKHKVLIVAWSCKFRVGDCVIKSKQLFNDWMNTVDPDVENPVPLDLRSVIYCNAIRSGDEREWDFLWQRYLKSNVGTEKTMILSALSCTREIWLLSRYLEWSLNSTAGVRKQDVTIVFAGISRGEVGFHLAKTFLIDRIDDIYNYLKPETSRLTRFVKPLADQMMSRKELHELKSLISENTPLFEKATIGINQALETVLINSQWQEKNYNEISSYLRTFSDEEM